MVSSIAKSSSSISTWKTVKLRSFIFAANWAYSRSDDGKFFAMIENDLMFFFWAQNARMVLSNPPDRAMQSALHCWVDVMRSDLNSLKIPCN